jgi:hypothetical protein
MGRIEKMSDFYRLLREEKEKKEEEITHEKPDSEDPVEAIETVPVNQDTEETPLKKYETAFWNNVFSTLISVEEVNKTYEAFKDKLKDELSKVAFKHYKNKRIVELLTEGKLYYEDAMVHNHLAKFFHKKLHHKVRLNGSILKVDDKISFQDDYIRVRGTIFSKMDGLDDKDISMFKKLLDEYNRKYKTKYKFKHASLIADDEGWSRLFIGIIPDKKIKTEITEPIS